MTTGNVQCLILLNSNTFFIWNDLLKSAFFDEEISDITEKINQDNFFVCFQGNGPSQFPGRGN